MEKSRRLYTKITKLWATAWRPKEKLVRKKGIGYLMLYYILFVWWVMIFWIYPRSLKPSMGRFVKYFMQNHFHRFPRDFQVDYSIHTQEIDSVKRPVKWEKKNSLANFSSQQTNKQQICCCQLQYLSFGVRPLRLLRHILTPKCLPIQSFDWLNSRQLLSCKTFSMKKYKQNMTSKLIQFGWVKLIVELMSIFRQKRKSKPKNSIVKEEKHFSCKRQILHSGTADSHEY